LPKSIENGAYLYDYDDKGMVAKQNPNGREMKRRDDLIERGAWTDEKTRKQFELTVAGGVLSGVISKAPKNGVIQYALSPDGKLYGKTAQELESSNNKGKAATAHTALLAGGDARCAGWIVTEGGKIVRVGNDSGHYRPHAAQLHQMLVFLQLGGVDLRQIFVQDADELKLYKGAEYFKWLSGGMKKAEMPDGQRSKNL